MKVITIGALAKEKANDEQAGKRVKKHLKGYWKVRRGQKSKKAHLETVRAKARQTTSSKHAAMRCRAASRRLREDTRKCLRVNFTCFCAHWILWTSYASCNKLLKQDR